MKIIDNKIETLGDNLKQSIHKNADLEDRGMALGIDINKPRRVFIASIDELDNLKDSQQGQSQIAKFENDVDAFL